MEFKTLLLKKENNIATLTLNRPERLNAINAQMMEELPCALYEIAQDKDLRVMILTGAGRAFCAGGDISQPTDSSGFGTTVQEISHGLRRVYRDTTLQLHNLEIPTIAMVNGVASGWGFDLALACDLRIGSDKARFMVAFTRVGLTPATGGVWLMPRIMGIAKAAELIFTADFLEAAEAQRLGVLNRVVPAADLEKEAKELARKIANGPPIAIRLAKMQLYRGMHTEMDAAFDTAAACQAICMTSEDHKEAVAAFGQKRGPIFKGK